MKGKEVLSQLSAYQQGKQVEEIKQEYGLEKIVKLASNENPYGYSSHLKDFLSSSVQELNIYPDGHASEIRKTISNTLNINEEKLVFGAGSDELIQLISRTFLYPGVNTIMATPTFSQYKHHAMIEGANIKEIKTKQDGYHDLDEMLVAVDDKTRIVWLCAPDNPTGTLISKEAFYQFMDVCPINVLVVLDEAYCEFIDDGRELSALAHLDSYQNLIILRTFSKAYGIAGLRFGYGMMHASLAAQLNVVRAPFNTSTIAQKAAEIAFKDHLFIQKTAEQNKRVKESFTSFLDEMGWHYYDSQTNFVLISTPISGLKAFDYLIQNGYIIRPGELLGYPNTIRVTIGLEEDMLELQVLLNQIHLKYSNEV